MLHANETWPMTKMNLQRLQRNERAMIRQICSIKPDDVATVRPRELLAKLESLDLILRERRLTWKKLTEKDCREWKLMTVDQQERSTWRSGVRSAKNAGSQLPGSG